MDKGPWHKAFTQNTQIYRNFTSHFTVGATHTVTPVFLFLASKHNIILSILSRTLTLTGFSEKKILSKF
nr:MAG TPA: hypothetical protein [Caudoviricetes sp.]